MSNGIVFDIETGSQSLEDLKKFMPPWDPASIGPDPFFDPKEVKTGNIKDEAKIAEKIEAAKQKHIEALAKYRDDMINGEARHWQAIQEKGALSALTGRVLAIGYKSAKGVALDHVEKYPEPELLHRFWNRYESSAKSNRKLLGFNIKDFDIPFLVQRSFITGVSVPRSLFNQGRYLDSIFVDLRDTWKAGQWNGNGSLDAVCRACGLGGKPDEVSGAQFAKFYENAETRQKALAYLANDLEMTYSLAERFGVL